MQNAKQSILIAAGFLLGVTGGGVALLVVGGILV